MQHPAHIRRCTRPEPSLRVPRARVPGFTLIELLVAMSILLILATITIRLVNTTLDGDRMKGGSRELQSYVAGARDRAIYAGQPRGVRFIPDQTDPFTVRSFVYVGAPRNFTDGQQISVMANSTAIGVSANTLTIWQNLASRGLLADGAQIMLNNVIYTIARNPPPWATPPNWTGNTAYALGTRVQPVPPNQHDYVCTTAGTSAASQPSWPTAAGATVTDGTVVWTDATYSPSWALTKPYAGSSANVPYAIQLSPAILTGEQPRSLPDRIVIDLRSSVLPTSWPSPSASSNLDVLFSPQGVVTGQVASSGRVHFVLSDIADTTAQMVIGGLSNRFQLNSPWQPGTPYQAGNVIVPTPSSYIAFRCTTAGTSGALAAQPNWPTQPNTTVPDNSVVWQSFIKKANLIVSLATATGRVTTSPVDVSDTLSPGYDSFRYAEIGEVTQ